MQNERPRTFDALLFETALQAAATAHGLPASCRRRTCRDSGTCMMRHQPWNGEIDRGCNPDFSIAHAAAEHIEFVRLLGWIDPEGTVYEDITRPHLEADDPNKLGSKPARRPEAWAKAIAAVFGIPAPLTLPLAWGEQPVRAANSSCRRHDERPANAGTLRSSGDPAGVAAKPPGGGRREALDDRR
jgi:hypothetical protein